MFSLFSDFEKAWLLMLDVIYGNFKSVVLNFTSCMFRDVFHSVDLVPKENVEKWLKYLRNEFPTVAFKASTQTQQEHLVGTSEKLDTFVISCHEISRI